MQRSRVAVVRTSRSAPSALVQPAMHAISALGHDVVDVPVTSGGVVSLDGYRAVVLLSPDHPPLRARHTCWREWDRWHATTVPWLTSVARSAGVRRLVLQSSALQYADAAAEPVDERSALAVTSATEPWCAAETATQRFVDRSHQAVVLRLAPLVDDPQVAPWLDAAATRPGGCLQARWQPRLTTSEAAGAVARSLDCPCGVHNVGVSVSGAASASAHGGQRRWVSPPPVGDLLPWRERSTDRLEPFRRSIRLSSEKFGRSTGWHPAAARFASRG